MGGGPLARREGCWGVVVRVAAGVGGGRAWRPCPAARVARLPRGAFAAALCGDGIPEMIQGPDIGRAIFEHTSDSYVIEWPFGLETHLPTDWVIFGVNVSPTKHVVFMGIAAALVRSEEHTSELQSPCNLVCRLLLEKKKMGSDRIASF